MQERLPREVQITNLSLLKEKKQERMNKMLEKATKEGQIRAFNRSTYLLHLEIEKEKDDLAIIEEDLRDLHKEINKIS